jgi:hypothetical protein
MAEMQDTNSKIIYKLVFNIMQLLTGSDDNSCFVWPQDWTVQSEGQTKQLLFEEPVYNRFVISYHM